MAPLFTGLKLGGFGKNPDVTGGGSTPITASGGNVNALEPGNGYVYHTFTSPGTFTVTSGTGEIEYLVVGGGGAGGGGWYRIAGAGGAGGLLSNNPSVPVSGTGATRQPSYIVSPGPYSVTVGPGGSASGLSGPIVPGNPSNFYPTPVSYPSPTYLRAFGGGGGAGNPNPGVNGGAGTAGQPGGSGGGYTEGGGGSPPAPTANAGNGTPGQGAGGSYPSSNGGGGGGAGGTMPNTKRDQSDGGNGLQLPAFTGPLIGVPSLAPLSGYFAGGGGGGLNSTSFAPSSWGQGGLGGGGQGNQWPNQRGPTGTPGTTNSGGGGGGGVAHENGSNGGGNGGPGIVVVRYLA